MSLKQINDLSWKLIPVAVVFVVTAAWWRARSSRRRPTAEGEKPERWVWDRNGQVAGPWWASRRIARALRPWAEQVPWTGAIGTWCEAGEKAAARCARQVARRWDDIADLLDWPSVFVSYDVDPECRIITVSAKERPDERELARKLAVKKIRNRRSHVQLLDVDDEPDLLQLVITDVERRPIQHRVVPERDQRVHTTINGVTTWSTERVRDERALYVVTGVRLTSLYTHGDGEPASWDVVPDVDTADEAFGADDGTIAVDDSPSPSRVPLRGATREREGGATPTPSRDSTPGVTVTERQLDVLRVLLAEGLSVAAVARKQTCTWAVAKRRLDRLEALGLAVRVADDRWELTSSARELLGVPVAPTPWPAPVPEEAS